MQRMKFHDSKKMLSSRVNKMSFQVIFK